MRHFKSDPGARVSPRVLWRSPWIAVILFSSLSLNLFADWPMYRGGPSLRGVATGTLPEKPSLLWTFNSKDEVRGSLAIVGDRVLFGSVDGHLYCVDKNTGKKIWAFKTEAEVESTPLVLGDVVYFGGGDGFFYAVHLENGTEKWKYQSQNSEE